jgi:hypothetical protein
MNRNLFLPILIVFFTTSFISIVGCNNQKSTKEQYQLQEQCGKRSEEWFKNKYGNEDEPSLSFQCHYNKKMNKCFIVITMDSKNKLNNKPYYKKSLFDINENKEYGFFFIDDKETNCFFIISNKECKHRLEWENLVKPYMEE